MTNWKPSDQFEWQQDAECSKPINRDIDFFSHKSEDKMKAKNLCFSCPVRKDCIKTALENMEIWGIWGGKDENEIRRTLSVNVDKAETRYERFPKCLYCGAKTKFLRPLIADNPEGGRWSTVRLVNCTLCDFTWRSRTSVNAVNAYFKLTSDKQDELDAQEIENEKLEESGIDLNESEEDFD